MALLDNSNSTCLWRHGTSVAVTTTDRQIDEFVRLWSNQAPSGVTYGQ